MLKNRIKNWLIDMINFSIDISDDVNVDIAKANYQKYQDKLEQQRKDYIKTVCNNIKIASINGDKSIGAADLSDDFITYEFVMEMKEYFEQKGFDVKVEDNVLMYWLRISWQ